MVDITMPAPENLRLSQLRTELNKSFNMELERVLRELELRGLDGQASKIDVIDLQKRFGAVLDEYADAQAKLAAKPSGTSILL